LRKCFNSHSLWIKVVFFSNDTTEIVEIHMIILFSEYTVG